MEEERTYERKTETKRGGGDDGGAGMRRGGAELEVRRTGGPGGHAGRREAALVSGTEDGEDAPAAAPEDETGVYTGSDYFASARLTRQQARDSAITLLQEAAAQENADTAVANEASEGIQALASFTLKEAQIENLVTAKGYADCVAFMGEDSISVVVSTGERELTGEDVAKITDIAMSETGYGAAGIKIMAAN